MLLFVLSKFFSFFQRAFRRETELENWIQKYDREMGEKQDELEQLESEFTEETTELKELEEKLGVQKLISFMGLRGCAPTCMIMSTEIAKIYILQTPK